MAHHKHWEERGTSAFKELGGAKGGDTGNANHAGYKTSQGRHASGGNVGKAGSHEGPAKAPAKTVKQLIGAPFKSQSGGKGTMNGSRQGAQIGKLSRNKAGGTSNYKVNSVQNLVGKL